MRIEAEMNDADIQKFFETYIKQANPTAVCNRLIRALETHLNGKNLNGGDPEETLLTSFILSLHVLHDDMSEMEEKLLGITPSVSKPPLL